MPDVAAQAEQLRVSTDRLEAALGAIERTVAADGNLTHPAAVHALATVLGLTDAAASSALRHRPPATHIQPQPVFLTETSGPAITRPGARSAPRPRSLRFER